jgi:transposase
MRGEVEPTAAGFLSLWKIGSGGPNFSFPRIQRTAVNYVGIDLHKKTIVVCVLDQHLAVRLRRTFACCQADAIRDAFAAVVEATASYPWLVALIEPLADEVVLAHPGKLRAIAESTKKTDRLDAQVLAEFLARDMIPRAYMPTPRQRQHRALVRHRQYVVGRITAARTKIRQVLADHNADRRDLFSTGGGKAYIEGLGLGEGEKFVVLQLWGEFEDHQARLKALTQEIKKFIKRAPQREAESRKVVLTAPGVGFVTAEVVLSELGDVSRFKNAKAVCAYAGLVPAVRQSGGKRSKDLAITKEGSGLLRWALVEAAWRLVATSRRWECTFERLKKRGGAKRAIVAVARKLLCVLYAMLRTSTPYKVAA